MKVTTSYVPAFEEFIEKLNFRAVSIYYIKFLLKLHFYLHL